MKELLETLTVQMQSFLDDAESCSKKGNKAAGQRARSLSFEIEKNMKQFRKMSIEAAKK